METIWFGLPQIGMIRNFSEFERENGEWHGVNKRGVTRIRIQEPPVVSILLPTDKNRRFTKNTVSYTEIHTDLFDPRQDVYLQDIRRKTPYSTTKSKPK